MRMKPIMLVGFACLCGLLLAQRGLAAIYQYVDKNGSITLVDDLQSVPEEYRASVKIVSGEDTVRSAHPKPGERPDGATGSVAHNPAPASSVHGTNDASSEAVSSPRGPLVSALVVLSGAFLFALAGVFGAGHETVVRSVRLVILWGVSVYLLVAHAGDAAHLVRKIGGGIESVQQRAGEKGKRAARAVKGLNELLGPADQSPAEEAVPEARPEEGR